MSIARDRVDVLVIGSGAAGGAISKRLAEKGVRVMCLEQGDWRKPSDDPSTGFDYEAQMQRPCFSFSPNERKRPEDYPVVTAGRNPPDIEMVNGVGGTTVHWNAQFLRLRPSDFRVKTLDALAQDWPIRYEDLSSYYEANEREMGVSGLSGDPANPGQSFPLPPLPIGVAGRLTAKGFNRLGWHWWIFGLGFLSRPYDGRPACDFNAQGWYGCGAAARAGMDVTYWPKAIRSGAILKTRARVCQISVDAKGRASGAVYYDSQRNVHQQLARVVVVCANGIGTPRLLLNSQSKQFPNGLANSSGLVGKGLMLHAGRAVRGIFEEYIDNYLHSGYAPLYSQQFYETDPRRNFARGYTLSVQGSAGPLATALGTDVPWGKDHHRVMSKRFPHMIHVTVIGEDLPDAANCVELDGTLKDSNGIPAPRVIYSFSENTRKLLEHGASKAREMLHAAGAIEIHDEASYPWTSHFMGTARMGSDRNMSVVNSWHQSHDVRNLFLVDGSSFVTSAAVGPTPTICALALRCADGIWARRSEWT
jgi:choline dehydrogenase-like flavoprotein